MTTSARSAALLFVLAVAGCAARSAEPPVQPLTPDNPVTGSVAFAKAVYYSIEITPQVAEDGLVVAMEFTGLPHLYARCGSLPTLQDFHAKETPQSHDEANLRLYMPTTSNCVNETMFLMAYGFNYSPSYKIEANFRGTIDVPPFQDQVGVVRRSNWQFYKFNVRNFARLRVVVKMTKDAVGSGVAVFWRRERQPTSRTYDHYITLQRTTSARCIDMVVPPQGLSYLGLSGLVGQENHYKLQIQPNLDPGTPCELN